MSLQRTSIDSKREEFRKYLEAAGVNDAITRILTMIMEREEPVLDPLHKHGMNSDKHLRFLKDSLEKGSPIYLEYQLAQKNLETVRKKLAKLEAENIALKDELETYRCKYLAKSLSISDK